MKIKNLNILQGRDFNMSKREDIEDLKREIALSEKGLKRLLEGYDGKNDDRNDLIKSRKLDIIMLQEELADVEQDYRKEKLEEMKAKLRADKNLDDNSLGANLRDINSVQKVIELVASISKLQISIQKNQILLDSTKDSRYSQMIDTDTQQLKGREQELSKRMGHFLKSFTLHQIQRGIITEEQRRVILEQQSFSLADVDKMFSDLSDTFNRTQQQPKTQMSKELAEKTLPRSDIHNIAHINDIFTKKQICEIYQVKNPEDVQIFAIQHYDHKTLREIAGINPNINLEEIYDQEFGEGITLCMFNKKTGKLEPMQNDNPPKIISNGQDINVNRSDGDAKIKELATISYSGVELTYYMGENGELQIARDYGDGLKEVFTDSLEHMEEVQRMQERMANFLQPTPEQTHEAASFEHGKEAPKTQERKAFMQPTLEQTQGAKSADEFREFFARARAHVEKVEAELRKIEGRTKLENKERVQEQERLDKDRDEGRIR